MRYVESLGRVLPEIIKPQINCRNEADFYNFLSINPPQEVTVLPVFKDVQAITAEGSVGVAAFIRAYNIKVDAKTQNGKRASYNHTFAEKCLDNDNFVERMGGKQGGQRLQARLEPLYELSTFISGYNFLKGIQSIYEDCKIVLKDSEKTFSEKDIEELLKVSQENNIKGWTKSDTVYIEI